MNDFIETKVNEWALLDNEIREVNQKIIHLEKRLFRDYLPCKIHDNDFFIRLKKWIENADNSEDQKTMFELIPHIFYISEDEITSLYRSAYNIEFARWLVNTINIDFEATSNEIILKNAVKNTWFCPVTDSFIINDFIKINNIPSIYNFRPDWHSLTNFGDPDNIRKYVTSSGIERVVLLEDFVGSSSQIETRIKFACNCLPEAKILFISLITCPLGITTLNKLEKKYPNLTIKHVISLPENTFISENLTVGENEIFTKTRVLINKLYNKTTNGIPQGKDPYYPLGFKKTGGIIVLNTNTPNNTLPMIHYESLTWSPLFKRITRL